MAIGGGGGDFFVQYRHQGTKGSSERLFPRTGAVTENQEEQWDELPTESNADVIVEHLLLLVTGWLNNLNDKKYKNKPKD